ncbi:MAG: hypothetical protein COT59_00980 [Candidatus Nealsonbacteria bacterium CG09_land_8_20_14_0_10_42_14]|uniref:GxxExxY protein n=1 Tax=Candidatus Nealsonbacteria bacterium CG09_land_8_20_14_0_10_42_14 TaxID=1974707 RepID=A0A2H0WXN4_9BACT|nr:MAG: hypothetical protein COT59_00980 [Candidatus Nealsonbacteria bacterium CG09_land_8_20_14_0_10_42_14]
MPIIRKRDKVLHPDLSYFVNGLCFKVHNDLGPFLSEAQYGDALENLLKANNLSYTRESALPVSFEGEENRRNITDFIIDSKIILEIKAKNMITKDDYYQLKRYLISAKKELGILINFRRKTLQPKRILNQS